MLEPCPDSAARQASIPRDWDWVIDDFRRLQDFQLEAFPGLRDYYAARFDYFFNRVPFRSIIPDTDRYSSFTQFTPAARIDEDDGPRAQSMSRARAKTSTGSSRPPAS